MENLEQLKAVLKVYNDNKLTNTLNYSSYNVLIEIIELLTLKLQNKKSVYINIVNDEYIHAIKYNSYIMNDKTIYNYKYDYIITGVSYSLIEALKRI